MDCIQRCACQNPSQGRDRGVSENKHALFFLRPMILKRDLPFDNFRYMLSNHNFFTPSEISTRTENSTISIIFTLFWCFDFFQNYQQLHVLNIHFIQHQICKKMQLKHVTIGNLRENGNTKKRAKIMTIVEFSILVEISDGLKKIMV